MKRLFSPWRLDYVAGGGERARGCVFCRAAKSRDDHASLVVARGRTHFVILNKYPYNNGHLMIVPRRHLASPSEAPAAARAEMMDLLVRSEKALHAAYRPAGINLGMNLGRAAGAGIEGHYHLHLVPRWEGDTNFMTVAHSTRVIPESLDTTWQRLHGLFAAPARATRRSAPRRSAARARDR